VHAAAVWLHSVQEQLGDRLQITWRSFSLEQANRSNRETEPGWRLWEQPDDYLSRGLWALRAGEAARNQGPALYDRYHMAVLRAKHDEKRDIADMGVLCELAEQSDLDLERFQSDLADRRLLKRICLDHTRAVQEINVFGTPTLVFGGGQAAYVKTLPPPPPDKAVGVFDTIRAMVADSPSLLEVKRPQKERKL
jgi:predicted DsbA family dithiol-disulfide isomerase